MRNLKPLILISCVIFLFGCSKREVLSETPHPVVPPSTVDFTPLVPLPAYWVMAKDLMIGFPNGIQVYKTNVPYAGKAVNAFCVVFDPESIEFKPVLADANKKLSQFYFEETGKVYAAINGGYFGTNATYSLVQYNGTISGINIKSLTRAYNGANATYYPTRGAFGLDAASSPGVTWIYHVGSGNGTVYSYPKPSPNMEGKAPQSLPTASFPSGASVWNASSAVGGSPVLIKDNEINITDKEELISVDNNSSRARSAIGHTSNGKVIILAVEGNNSSGGAGLNLKELAQMMKEMGCEAALNLDGGGSTSLMAAGKQTVRPSDGQERAVMSAIILKSK